MSARPGQIAALKEAIAAREGRLICAAGVMAPIDLVRRVVAEEIGRVCGIPPEHLRDEQRLAALGRCDDLDMIELALAIEERLQLLGHLHCRAIGTVGDVVRAAAAIPREAPRP